MVSNPLTDKFLFCDDDYDDYANDCIAKHTYEHHQDLHKVVHQSCSSLPTNQQNTGLLSRLPHKRLLLGQQKTNVLYDLHISSRNHSIEDTLIKTIHKLLIWLLCHPVGIWTIRISQGSFTTESCHNPERQESLSIYSLGRRLGSCIK